MNLTNEFNGVYFIYYFCYHKSIFTPLNKAVDPIRYKEFFNGVNEIGGNKLIAVPVKYLQSKF